MHSEYRNPAPNGCLGSCCKEFHVFDDASGYRTHMDIIQQLSTQENDIEAAKLTAMLIPIKRQIIDNVNYFMWTCKWWNTETGLCMNYENRPSMCSGFPNYPESSKLYDRGCCYNDKCTFTNMPLIQNCLA